MVRTLHDAGIEVILDVVYNHTAEGNELGPDAVVSRHRQRRLLPAGARRTALLPGLHRLRQHPQHAASARAADGHGFAALLGRPRCTSTASASTWPRRWRASCTGFDQRGGFLDAVRQDPVLSRGQADRRAVGPGRRRLPGRRLPRRLGGVERQVPRHDARASGRATRRLLARIRARGCTGSSDLFNRSSRRP